jgi:hypothetical protein
MLARSPITTASALGSAFLASAARCLAARMQDDTIPLIGERLTGRQSQTVGRTRYENARHCRSPDVEIAL